MRRIFLVLGMVMGMQVTLHAQMLTPEVLAAGGDVFVNTQANINLAFTIGEIALVETFSAQNYHLTQGFHQPTYDLVGIDDEEFVDLFEVYPNPASESLNIRYALKHPGRLEMRLYNMNGVEVVEAFTQRYSGGLNLHSFDVTQIAQGMYFLKVQYQAPGRQIDHLSHYKINVINP